MRRPGRLFYFRLASMLGCTVQELTGRLTLGELREWQAYDQIEPFGLGRLVLQAAVAMRMQLGKDSGVELMDLVPYYRPPPPEPAKQLSDTEVRGLDRRMQDYFRARAGQ